MTPVPSALEEQKGIFRNFILWLAACVAFFGGFLFGYDTAVINGANQFLKIHFNLNSVQEGMAGASAIIGCIPGAMFCGLFQRPIWPPQGAFCLRDFVCAIGNFFRFGRKHLPNF
ncbi:MAG: MFS transporter [Limisphaerales bacterium]